MLHEPLRLDRDGAELRPGLATPLLEKLEQVLAGTAQGRAGVRLVDCPPLASLLSSLHPIGCEAAKVLGPGAQPVRAVLFDKSPQANWQLDWHQDRTIAVRKRHEAVGFAHWNVKQGIVHVEPPFSIMEQMLTVRVHLDPAGTDNGVLEVVTGSHRQGRITEPDIAAIAARGPVRACTALAGDCWLYRTPIVHRSARSRSTARRRVLQVDYCALPLPNGLEWRGI